MSQYDGFLSERTASWRKTIIYLLSKLEALIDFSDEELPLELEKDFYKKTLLLLKDMRKSIKSSKYAERLRNGFIITLIGRQM